MAKLPLPRPPRELGVAARAAATRVMRLGPVLPEVVVTRALWRERGGVYPADPGAPQRPVDYSQPAIDRTRRRMLATQQLMDPAPRDLERSTIELPHCTAERLRVRESRTGRMLLYFHGGGYLRGCTDTHIGAISRFMRASGTEALSVDYRLAPEHDFPDWIDDALDAYRWLLDEGIAPESIAVGGDSAGGGLTLALIQRLREERLPMPACAFVISPWADLTSAGTSHQENRDLDAMFGPGVIEDTATWLAERSGVPGDHPLLSPAFGDFTGAPPLQVHVSQVEVLRADAEMVVSAYRADGAQAELHVHRSAPHAWTAIGVLRSARRTARETGDFIRAHIG